MYRPGATSSAVKPGFLSDPDPKPPVRAPPKEHCEEPINTRSHRGATKAFTESANSFHPRAVVHLNKKAAARPRSHEQIRSAETHLCEVRNETLAFVRVAYERVGEAMAL